MTTLVTWTGVAVLGGLASLARVRLDDAVTLRTGGPFPWGTTVVNVIGAFLAGALVGVGVDGSDRVVLAIGVLGSFSTFSTWMLETTRLWSVRRRGVAVANVVAGGGLGLAAAALGWAVGALS